MVVKPGAEQLTRTSCGQHEGGILGAYGGSPRTEVVLHHRDPEGHHCAHVDPWVHGAEEQIATDNETASLRRRSSGAGF